MIRIVFRSRHLDRLEGYTAEVGAALRKLCQEQDDGTQVLGPAPAPVMT